MISIDRSSNTPVREQLVEQLRYLIASGHYHVSETLPSTRTLGDQLDVSFHTVRKAYQALQDEGLIESKPGTGYTVKERTPLDKGERMERGASIVRDALQHLIGLGLDEEEIDYLVQEQASLLDHAGTTRKLIVTGPHPEINAICAEQIGTALQRSVTSVSFDQLERHQDADFLFAPFALVNKAMNAVPRADTFGFVTHLPSEALERVARLLEHETLGLVTRQADTIQPLMRQIRADTGFSGQVIAVSTEEGDRHMGTFVDETDWILYTPRSRRSLLRHLKDQDAPSHTAVAPIVSTDSLEAIRRAVPA